MSTPQTGEQWHRTCNDKEIIMDRIKHPGKEAARDWLMQRQATRAPLPDIEQIRRELGWKFLEQQQARKAH